MIGFIGSVFSPWYAWAGRRQPENHVCLNVALYGRGGRFAMTERGAEALRLAPERLQIGPSAMSWDGTALTIEVDEISNPVISRLRGRIRLRPTAITGVELPLCGDGGHVWRPFAPTARIEVDLGRDLWRWQGHGYFDANFGTRALEADFSYWSWARLPRAGGTTATYDVERRDGSALALALQFWPDGGVTEIETPPLSRMARSLWAVRRHARADAGTVPRQVRSMLDAPFYSRSMIRTRLLGEEVEGVHEALDLDRFANPLLKPMLALRVPRRSAWRFTD